MVAQGKLARESVPAGRWGDQGPGNGEFKVQSCFHHKRVVRP